MKAKKLIWDEDVIDGCKTWSAPGPYTDEVGAAEFDWRIRLCGECFVEASDLELMGFEHPRSWANLERAMQQLEGEHEQILKDEGVL